MGGRPKANGAPRASWTEEMAEDILRRTRLGEPLAQVCRTEGYVSPDAVYLRVQNDPAFGDAYKLARVRGFDAIAEETLKIADEVPADRDHVQKAKLRIETRIKLLSKWDPKRYGDMLRIENEGPTGLTDQQLDEQLERLTRRLYGAGEGRAGGVDGGEAAAPEPAAPSDLPSVH